MTKTKRLLIAAGGGAVTFALILFAAHNQLASKLPSGFGMIPLYLLLPLEIVGEVLASRAAALITGFLEFFLLWWLALLCWAWTQPRKRG
jgi:hypothetical protein